MNNDTYAKAGMTNFIQAHYSGIKLPNTYVLAMKITLFLTIALSLQVSANALAQMITLVAKNKPLAAVLDEVRQQSGYDFLFNGHYLDQANPVTVDLHNVELQEALPLIFEGQPFLYEIDGRIITLNPKTSTPPISGEPRDNKSPALVLAYPDVRGRVVDSLGNPLVGASIRVLNTEGKRTILQTVTDHEGYFALRNVPEKAMLEVSFVGYIRQEVKALANLGSIILEASPSGLDEVVVVGYGETSRRFNTGSVATVSSKEIEQQPVTNVLSALSGRMPGVFIQTANGLPGGNINIQIRGKGSIDAGTQPLFIIDGVPFDNSAIGEGKAYASQTALGTMSPLNLINPTDIESISVLKDADATAIYGSRGANGVMLIQTKKGQAGRSRIAINAATGVSRAANLPSLLSLAEHLEIRREAFANDGLEPSADPTSPNYAPDLTVWSQTEATDWAEYLLGSTAMQSNIQGSISGGTVDTRYMASGNYRSEGSILPGDARYQRGGMHVSLSHRQKGSKFGFSLSNIINVDQNRLSNFNNLNNYVLLPPNYPMYDAAGNLNWELSNPIATENQRSRVQGLNVVTNIVLDYRLADGLVAKVSAGYHRTNTDQVHTFPQSAIQPDAVNFTNFVDHRMQTFIVEPQLHYTRSFRKSVLEALLGGTYQDRNSFSQSMTGERFPNEALQENLASASIIKNVGRNDIRYRYASVFARASYRLDQRYIVNLTARRDGSSRFGPGNRFGNFGSLGAAWLFGSEPWVTKALPWLSYGKLRASYGWTGNDQIPDYQYLDTYSSASQHYNGMSVLRPVRIANADFRWEYTRKLETALELGIFGDRILLNVARYLNRSSDQLVGYTLPMATGFPNYQANLPAVVENSGWEFSMQTQNINGDNFRWNTGFNLTLPRNVLESFRDFENSTYIYSLEIGYDITRVSGRQFLGIDPETGTASYLMDPESPYGLPAYFERWGKQTPDFYGGMANNFSYKGFSLDVFLHFAKQMAEGGLQYTPGSVRLNNYSVVTERWQKVSDITSVPRASTIYDFDYPSSSANFFDASYLRLKNVALSYRLPDKLLGANIAACSFMLQMQNLWTWWDRSSALLDPESGGGKGGRRTAPPLRSMVLGVNLSF